MTTTPISPAKCCTLRLASPLARIVKHGQRNRRRPSPSRGLPASGWADKAFIFPRGPYKPYTAYAPIGPSGTGTTVQSAQPSPERRCPVADKDRDRLPSPDVKRTCLASLPLPSFLEREKKNLGPRHKSFGAPFWRTGGWARKGSPTPSIYLVVRLLRLSPARDGLNPPPIRRTKHL